MEATDQARSCPCGTERSYDDCCGPLLSRRRTARTAEELMRSRYTAFVETDVDYIRDTLHPKEREQHDDRSVRSWSRRSEWLGLEIKSTERGGEEDDRGYVEFVARYRSKGELIEHHEEASFRKVEGTWYFVDGQPPAVETVVRTEPKVSRNAPCPCGSGKKAKKCCGA